MDSEHFAKDFPEGSGDATLQVAAWHLQTVLAAIGNSDGKVMFLTALNTAGLSALVGIAVTSSPEQWLLGLGFASSGLCAVIGLGRLWAANVRQFPRPEEAWDTARRLGKHSDVLLWQHVLAVQDAVVQADASLRRSALVMRTMLTLTSLALTLVVAAALTTAS